ncbi:MAG: NAD(+) synthase [Leptospiraceae bacterium]|nr:MAG: NAD(+) synthase [Leptospiraceae bacterium]
MVFYFPVRKKQSWQNLIKIIQESKKLTNTLICIGTPFYYRGNIYNCIAIIFEGELLALIPKSYLAGEGIHYEQRWFTPYKDIWKKIEVKENNIMYEFYFGQGIIDFFDVRIGIEICEDAWINHRPSLFYFYDHDIDLILNPAASHFGFGKYEVRKNIAKATSFYYHCYYISVNLLGNESGKAIYDGSFILTKNGELLFEIERFSFKDIMIRSFPLEFNDLRNLRDRIYSRRKDRKEDFDTSILLPIKKFNRLNKPIFETDLERETNAVSNHYNSIIEYEYINEFPKINHLENQYPIEFIEFLDVERLALFDYMRKTNSKGYTISLSGGADSSLCAILVYQMIRKGIIELGLKNFIKKIHFIIEENDLKILEQQSIEEQIQYFSNRILHTIYQKTDQNTERTYLLANELAKEIHSHHININIQNLIDESINLFEKETKIKLSWENNDISLQNIQARMRNPLAWLLANTTNSILIVTSNRSEASVGYATMDGDTSGGVAPIAGIDKAFILKFLDFIGKYKDEYTIPVETAQKILKQPPSAELRPIDQEQTDEKDLMPYPILSMIERFAIEELLSPEEIFNRLINYRKSNNNFKKYYKLPYFSEFLKLIQQYNEEEIKEMVNKFFHLWHINQWKRERFATTFHIDSFNVDPRGWFRFPVLSKFNKIK